MSGMMHSRQVPAVISVDSYQDKIVTGRFWQGGEGSEAEFSGLMSLVLLIDQMLAKTQDAAHDTRCKRFVRPEKSEMTISEAQSAEPTRGALATFRLHILFRQNVSWQGIVTWIEGQQESSFRSFLELTMLLDSALCFSEENKNA